VIKISIISLIIVFFLITILIGCIDTNIKNEDDSNQHGNIFDDTDLKFTFNVTVPENTPDEDIIYLYIYGNKKFKMNKTSEYSHQISLNEDDFDFITNEKYDKIIWYRYSRNGWDFATAEFLTPDTNDYFWMKMGRETFYKPGKTRNDKVSRWRWFPEGDIIIENTSNLGPLESDFFINRINNQSFRSGQGIQDLYIDGFEDFFKTTAEHLIDRSYQWVVLYPAWDWIKIDPLPKLQGSNIDGPEYPDYILFEQINDYKNAGLKVILGPQICCTMINYEHRSIEWWEQYFSEIERFLMHYATIASNTGVEAFFADITIGNTILEDQQEYLEFFEQQKWSEIWDSIKEIYDGEIGQMIWNLGVVKFSSTSPSADFVIWGDKLDFFYIQSEGEITSIENPSDKELSIGVERELDALKPFYDIYNKPIIIQTAYHSIKDSWRGFEYAQLGKSGCGESDSENSCKFIFSGYDQARIINEFFKLIKDKSWIIGYFHFGYWQYEMPLLTDWSIRGKAAEDVWEKWNNIIYP
jgi:hypothetical protein